MPTTNVIPPKISLEKLRSTSMYVASRAVKSETRLEQIKSLMEQIKELKILAPAPIELPALEHFNVYEDHVTVMDRRRRMFADVYFRNKQVYCALRHEEDCEHVEYALNLPKVERILSRKGWVIREGKIIRKPF